MVSLKTIGGIALGAYIFLNPGTAHSKDIDEFFNSLDKCKVEEYPQYKNNPAQLRLVRDKCIETKFFEYAKDLIYKDGIARPDEIHLARHNIREYIKSRNPGKNPDMGDLLIKNDSDIEIKKDSILAPEPIVTEEKRIPNDRESLDKKIIIEYRSTTKDAELSIVYDGKNFTFSDSGNDGKFNNESDCITDNEIKICGDNLKDTIALVDGKETTHDTHFKEAKRIIIKAFADYLLNAVNTSAIYYPMKDGVERLDFSDNKYRFIVMDYGNDGITDTFHVWEEGNKDSYILYINKDDSEVMKDIIGGLLPSAKIKAKK